MAESSISWDPVAGFLESRRCLLSGLDDTVRRQCADRVRSTRCADGGFAGPGGRSDLYYTFFALADLSLLGEPIDSIPMGRYLSSFGAGESLDLVHLCCLLRCRNLVAMSRLPVLNPGRIGQFIQAKRHGDTVRLLTADAQGSRRVYDLFLAVQAGRELGLDLLPADMVRAVLSESARVDGGYSGPASAQGTTTITAAAVWLWLWLDGAAPASTLDWLSTVRGRDGGFKAAPNAPASDLLSTASALQALVWAGVELGEAVPGILDFVESCWMDEGLFGAHGACSTGDVEYTFYGLSALGNLLR